MAYLFVLILETIFLLTKTILSAEANTYTADGTPFPKMKDKGNTKNVVVLENTSSENLKFVVLTNLLVKNCILVLLTQIQLNQENKIILRIILNYPSITGKNIFSNL